MPSHGRPIARAPTDTQPYTNRKTGTRYTLTTYLEVMTAVSEHADHAVLDSALWYEARFSLKPAERQAKEKGTGERGTHVGHLYAYVVDQTKADKRREGLAWIEECLTPGPAEKAKGKAKGSKKAKIVQEEEKPELQLVLQELFDAEGEVRDQIAKHAQELHSSDRIVFIDGFQLSPAHRGTGLAQTCMAAFLRLLPLVGKGYDVPAGTPVVLSPAAHGDARVDNGKTDVEIERGLVRAYERSGFTVWIQGPEEVEGSVTVIGRVVPEAKVDDQDEEDGGGAADGGDEVDWEEGEVEAEESEREQEQGKVAKRSFGLRRRR